MFGLLSENGTINKVPVNTCYANDLRELPKILKSGTLVSL